MFWWVSRLSCDFTLLLSLMFECLKTWKGASCHFLWRHLDLAQFDKFKVIFTKYKSYTNWCKNKTFSLTRSVTFLLLFSANLVLSDWIKLLIQKMITWKISQISKKLWFLLKVVKMERCISSLKRIVQILTETFRGIYSFQVHTRPKQLS